MLTLTAQVWYKLVYLAKQYKHEVSGFGISTAKDPFYITDFKMVEQYNDAGSTEMTEEGLAAYMDHMLAEGKAPAEFMRIWCHTHPTGVNGPSTTDNATMEEVFGECDWAVMLIVTKEPKIFAEIHTKALDEVIKTKAPVTIDWLSEGTTDTQEWEEEHDLNHKPWVYVTPTTTNNTQTDFFNYDGVNIATYWEWEIADWLKAKGKITDQQFSYISKVLSAGQPMSTYWIDMYKEESGDTKLNIARTLYT